MLKLGIFDCLRQPRRRGARPRRGRRGRRHRLRDRLRRQPRRRARVRHGAGAARCSVSRPSSAGPRASRFRCPMDDRGRSADRSRACWRWPGTTARSACACSRGSSRAGARAGGAGGSGLAVDVVRRAVDPAAPPVRWPLGLAPPARLVAGAAADRRRRWRALLLATLRARVVYGTAIATGRLIHVDLVPELRARVFDKLLRLGFGFFRAQRQRLDHQPRHRRRAVAALVRRRRAAAGGAAAVHARRLRRLHGRAFTSG